LEVGDGKIGMFFMGIFLIGDKERVVGECVVVEFLKESERFGFFFREDEPDVFGGGDGFGLGGSFELVRGVHRE
jgi:hypothetical protein